MEPVEEPVEVVLPVCVTCGGNLSVSGRFCPHCGALQAPVAVVGEDLFEHNARVLALFYFVILIVCLAVAKIDAFADYTNLVFVEGFIAIWTLVFAFTRIKEMISLYSLKNLKPLLLLACAGGAMVASIIVSTATNWFNLHVFDKELDYWSTYENLEYAVPVFFASVAFYPAIIEELGFRGVFYSYMNEVSGRRNAIILSSVAFGILHVSLVALIWLVPFALVAAYLRFRYNTLWYGMVMHFCFNATVCILELLGR